MRRGEKVCVYVQVCVCVYRCVCVFVCDTCVSCSRETYNALTNWLADARTLASPNIAIILCGNKKDLGAEREVTFLEASRFAQENGTPSPPLLLHHCFLPLFHPPPLFFLLSHLPPPPSPTSLSIFHSFLSHLLFPPFLPCETD